MRNSSYKVQKLLDDVQLMRDQPRLTKSVIQKISDRVAELLLGALWDNDNAISDGLKELEERVDLEKEGKLFVDNEKSRRRKVKLNPLRHFFMPHPGAGDPEARRLWRVQLLLYVAATSPKHGASLAEKLLISPQAMMEAAQEAANAVSVASWSVPQYLEYLLKSISLLNTSDEVLPCRIDGRDLSTPGERVRVSAKEARYLNLLIERSRKPVSFQQMRDVNVNYPAETKNLLLKRLEKFGVTLTISTGPKFHTLLSADFGDPACGEKVERSRTPKTEKSSATSTKLKQTSKRPQRSSRGAC